MSEVEPGRGAKATQKGTDKVQQATLVFSSSSQLFLAMHSPGDIKNKADFLLFMRDFQMDLRKNPAEWENQTLPDFLEALAAFTADLDGYYHNLGQAEPTAVRWDVFATILQAARIYE